MQGSLALSSAAQLFACASFIFVAWSIARRPSPQAHVVRAFALAWASMAVLMLERGVLGLAASVGVTPLEPLVAARFLEVLLVSLTGWGICFYVAYLYTGKAWLRPAFAAYFAILGVAYATLTALGRPDGVGIGPWSVGLLPATPHIDIVYAGYGIPILVSTAAYLRLAWSPLQPIQRYRVILVSSSLIAWTGSGLAASLAGDSFFSFLAITVLGVITAAAVFFAYHPPAFAAKRWA